MFGSSILEVAIGVIFIYLLLSLICTAINEYISALLNKRGENLFEGIRNLLNDPTFTGLAQKIYNHGLVDGISQASKNPYKPARRPSYMDKKTFALALMDNLSSQTAGESWKLITDQRKTELATAKARYEANPKDSGLQKTYHEAQRAAAKTQDLLTKVDEVKRAYDDAECAARLVSSPKDVLNLRAARDKLERALVMGRVLAAELPEPLENIERGVMALPEGHTKQSLLVLINKTRQSVALLHQVDAAAYEIEILQKNIEEWFDDAMDRVSGWYKRWTQKILLWIGAIVVIICNADTIVMVKTFYRDNAMRESIVSLANAAVSSNNPAEDKATREKLLEAAAQRDLPIGWFPSEDDPYRNEQVPCIDVPLSQCLGELGFKLVGLLISVVAVWLGAPFWFDFLSKFVNIRSAGIPPGESPKSGPQPVSDSLSMLAALTSLSRGPDTRPRSNNG